MVCGVRSVAHVGGVRGEQERGLKFAVVHVVVIAARDASGPAGLRPVLAARIKPDAHRTVGVGLLHHIGEHVVAAVTIHDHEPALIPCRTREIMMSATTAASVAGLRLTVPGNSECSCEHPNVTAGS